MQIEKIKGAKTWGVIEHPKHPGHFHTGYVGQWAGQDWALVHEIGSPEKHMLVGENVVITADFRLNSMSRGRSAANFSGNFRFFDDFEYEFGMQGTMELIDLIQSGVFSVSQGYITGRWTFAKQGASIFLKPYLGA